MGLSLKGMQERIGESTYYGAAADFGANVDVLPFLRLSFVIQDIGQTMQGDDSEEKMKRRYDFGYPRSRCPPPSPTGTGISRWR